MFNLNVMSWNLKTKSTQPKHFEVKLFNKDSKEIIDSNFDSLPDPNQTITISQGGIKNRRIEGTVARIDEFETNDENFIKADVYLDEPDQW